MNSIYIREICVIVKMNTRIEICSKLDLFMSRKMYIDIFQTAESIAFCFNIYLNITMSK